MKSLLLRYFPTQKCENTSFTTDSVVRSPVSSVKAFSASSRTMLTASRVMPPLTASSASEMQLIALSRHCFWRSFTESSSHTLLSVINKSYNTSCNLSVPSPFAAEISTTLSKLLKTSCLSRTPSQSLLFMQAIFLAEAFLQALIRLLSSSSRGMLLSKTAMIRSAEESFSLPFQCLLPQ